MTLTFEPTCPIGQVTVKYHWSESDNYLSEVLLTSNMNDDFSSKVLTCIVIECVWLSFTILSVALMITFFSSFKKCFLINHGTTFSVLVTIGFSLNLMYYCGLLGTV